MRTALTLALAALICAADPAKTPTKPDAPRLPEFVVLQMAEVAVPKRLLRVI